MASPDLQAFRRTVAKEKDPAKALALAIQGHEFTEHLVLETVRKAREEGLSWTQVGQAFAVSKQSAFERFRHVEEPDTRSALDRYWRPNRRR